MEARAFPRADVREFLSKAVCLKMKDTHPAFRDVADKFNVKGFPTLVLLDPSGNTLLNQPGAPPAEHFVGQLSVQIYNRMIKLTNAGKYVNAVDSIYTLRTYFKGTEDGKVADRVFEDAKMTEGFLEAYEERAKRDAEAREKTRERIRAERMAFERAAARKIKEEGDALYKKGKRAASYKFYKKVIAEYPRTPEAEEARKLLKKRRVKWEEPKGD